jgi:hypothetical protein
MLNLRNGKNHNVVGDSHFMLNAASKFELKFRNGEHHAGLPILISVI